MVAASKNRGYLLQCCDSWFDRRPAPAYAVCFGLCQLVQAPERLHSRGIACSTRLAGDETMRQMGIGSGARRGTRTLLVLLGPLAFWGQGASTAADIRAAQTVVRGIAARESAIATLRGTLTSEVWRSRRQAESWAEYGANRKFAQVPSPSDTYGYFVVRFLVTEGRWRYRMASVDGLYHSPWETQADLGGRLAWPAASVLKGMGQGEYVQVVEIGDGERRLTYINASAELVVSVQANHNRPAAQSWLGEYLFLSDGKRPLSEQLDVRLGLVAGAKEKATVTLTPDGPLATDKEVLMRYQADHPTCSEEWEVTVRLDLGFAPVRVFKTFRPKDVSRKDIQAYGQGLLWFGEDFKKVRDSLWLPMRVTIQSFSYGPGIKEPWVETHRVTFRELTVNGPCSETDFHFDTPLGTRVHGPSELSPESNKPWLPMDPKDLNPGTQPPILEERLNKP